MKPRISVLTIGVSDLGSAVEFYRDGLGLMTEGIIGEQFEHGAVAFFDLQSGLRGASAQGWGDHREARAGNVLGRLHRLFPGSRSAPVGGRVESGLRTDRVMPCEGSRQIRLVEFDTSDGAEQWCEAGHIGYVLKGALSISFNGDVVSFRAGDGLFIPSGASSKHRSVSIAAGTQLLMVEDI